MDRLELVDPLRRFVDAAETIGQVLHPRFQALTDRMTAWSETPEGRRFLELLVAAKENDRDPFIIDPPQPCRW